MRIQIDTSVSASVKSEEKVPFHPLGCIVQAWSMDCFKVNF